MKTVYSINQGAICFADAYSKDDAVEAATAYFQQQREEEGFVGKWTEEVSLNIYDEATDKETTEQLTLTGEAEKYEV